MTWPYPLEALVRWRRCLEAPAMRFDGANNCCQGFRTAAPQLPWSRKSLVRNHKPLQILYLICGVHWLHYHGRWAVRVWTLNYVVVDRNTAWQAGPPCPATILAVQNKLNMLLISLSTPKFEEQRKCVFCTVSFYSLKLHYNIIAIKIGLV
jgi:hypothetical protein